VRIVVTGKSGQVVTALVGLAAQTGRTVVALGRPELDLADPTSVLGALTAARADVIVNAAAYTAVDQAESEPDVAMAVNGVGAGAVAAAARALGVPVVHISTDYVFAGDKPTPYVETDLVGPVGAYGRSKLAGEQAVAIATPDHAILRTAWVYAAAGKNFLNTMLRVARTRPELTVVADQFGCPSYAPDIARATLRVCENLVAAPQDPALRGVFHMAGGGETHWAGFAEAIFARSALRGGPVAQVRHIPTSAYPTPARRPANSRLNCEKMARVHGVHMPDWREALDRCFDVLDLRIGA
jgi:dTDP-4-dehydrorhamnose reductase